MKTPEQITSDIFQVGVVSHSTPQDAAVYLIKDGNKSALVDAGNGENTPAILESIKLCGIELSDVAYIFVTHCHFDHTGGINELREATGAKVVIHQYDSVALKTGDLNSTGAEWGGGHIDPTPVDIIVGENQKDFALNKLNVTMHHTPGHSPGSAVFTVNSDNQLVLFGQDVHGPVEEVLQSNQGEFVVVGGFSCGGNGMLLLSNKADYKKSLEFMAGLDADILCEGHLGTYVGKEKVSEFINSFL
ncbi:MAG: MBL fold metallo-hydrolase [Leptospirales bacterium]|nr:MBL fold metallo-hydrolase [Leptospirales bacterium]